VVERVVTLVRSSEWTGETPEVAGDSAGVQSAATEERDAAPLRRVVVARVLSAVVARLRAEGAGVQVAALDAVRRALAEREGGAPTGSGSSRDGAESARGGDEVAYDRGHRLVALTLTPPLYAAVAGLARSAFGGDVPAATGWLVARGTGVRLALPGAVDGTRAAPRSRRAQIDVDAPGADELRARREEIGLSQKEVAAAAGLSRGLVAEVERGRRANALTRLRIAETLAALARQA
jgi:DNA-binding XRE family transcriptional regulator